MESCDTRPDLLQSIQILTSSLRRKGVRVRHQWIPSHIGIQGNEKADQAAKAGARRPGRPDITVPSSISDLVRRVDRAAWSLWAREYHQAALQHGWPATQCQEQSTDTLFIDHPPQIGHLMSRIRLNWWKTKYVPTICTCLQQPISIQHCLFECSNLQPHFQPLRELLKEEPDKLRALQTTTKNSPDGWRPLTLAATLVYTSAVGPYL